MKIFHISTGQRILHEKNSHAVEELWNDFKETLSKSLNENIPEKLLKHANLPWITNDLRRNINELEKKMIKCKKSGIKRTDCMKSLKAKIQKEQRSSYWKYVENMIFSDSDEPF